MTLRLIDDVVNVISCQMLSVVPFAAVICFGKLQRLSDICKPTSSFVTHKFTGYIFVPHVQNALSARRSFATLRMTSRATEIATSGIALLAMTTPCVVILNEVKNLLEADKRPRT